MASVRQSATVSSAVSWACNAAAGACAPAMRMNLICSSSADSGEAGAELWCYWLMRALGWPEIVPSYKGGFEIIRTQWLSSEQSEASVMATGDTPVEALYAAWQEQEKAQ